MSAAPKSANWENCRAEFEPDGGLVDLIAPGTTAAHWEEFWAGLRSGPFDLRVCRDNAPIPVPETAEWCLREQNTACVYASVLAGNVTANCHFFGGDLELDIDPREVLNEAELNSVLSLMRLVAAAVRLPVLATPEGGGAERAFLRVLPEGRAEFLSP
ncbi:MAG: hypothetical protein FD180_2895 [Planctomycetota bacterium]|nr:MAG: hypothetical protein FD180_2895 [Planctomycetota bacterium]